ncbi:PREDICTED: Transposon [Prunus dulcis]|uniref:PREDICTED: Transposon n=1 Tax=Prunus dulcis TaxID=3755 RepID=A0A5E4EEN3_PRUDU|nr:PREDICTED: Transposon [Prunus dulcis]
MGRKGQTTASLEVAAIAEAELDAQHELWDSQIQEVQVAVTALAVQSNMSDVQKSLAAHQDQNVAFQKSMLEEIRSLCNRNSPPVSTQSERITSTGLPPHSTVLSSSATVLGSQGAMATTGGIFSTNHTFTAPNHPIFAGAGPSLGFLASNPYIPPAIVLLGASTMGSPSLQPQVPIPQYSQSPLRTTVNHPLVGPHTIHSGSLMSLGPHIPYHSASQMMPISPRPHFPQFSSMKPMKLDLPHFYGEDPYGWLAMAERFLEYHEVEESRKVMVAAMHLGGDAALWMKWYEARYPRDSWAIFSDMLLQRFGPGEALNVNVALSWIRKMGSVAEFVAQFIKLSCRAVGWTDELLLGVFVGGLKEEIQDDVLALEPKNLARAMELAQIYENKQIKKRASFRANNTKSFQPPLSPRTKPHFSTPGVTSKPTTFGNRPEGPMVQRKTQSELQERLLKGLCFYCDDPMFQVIGVNSLAFS